MDKEFIIRLLSKLEDTPENRNLLETFISNIDRSTQGTSQQKTIKIRERKNPLEEQNTDKQEEKSTPSPESIKTLPTTMKAGMKEKSKHFFNFERYEDIELLGRGGMGEVRKVRDRYLNRFVAMKIVQFNVLRSSDGLNRFIEEARVNAQLQHPNIVPVHDIGVLEDGRYYFTMKEIKGRELSDIIYDVYHSVPGAPTLYQLMTIFHTVVDTIAFAHSHGVLHRDVKPSNIFIGDFGEVLVLDWGIAKFIHSMTHEKNSIVSIQPNSTLYGNVSGTPIYMSPEQAEGGIDLDERSDIYSLGAILYEILSGRPPYMGDTAEHILLKVRNEEPPSLELFSPTSLRNSGTLHNKKRPYPIPTELIEICNQSMYREKNRRYSTAKELANLIQNWLMGLQKKRKAEGAFSKAQTILQEIEKKKRDNIKREEKCTQYFSSTKTKEDAWKIWTIYSEEKIQIKILWRKYKEQLEHTLFHSHNYQPAHVHIIRVLSEEYNQASQQKDTHALHRIKSQYNKHKRLIVDHTEIPQTYSSNINSNIHVPLMIGRKKEKEDILFALKKNTRIIGVVGYVGIGKKLFIQHIQQHVKKKRVLFCSLQNVRDKSEFWQKLSVSLNLQTQSSTPVQEISSFLNSQETILILCDLDGYEQVIAQQVQALLNHTSTLTILYTSVQRIDIHQEYILRLSPLSIFESLVFFQQKVQEILPQFTIKKSNQKIVHSICLQLGGLPLAIEIATTHLRTLSLEDLYSKMMKYALHQTQQDQIIQQAFFLSWDRLQTAAQYICVQLLIFPEDASGEALEHILLPTQEFIFDVLEILIHHNLVFMDQSTGEKRYGILPSMRSFVRGKETQHILSKKNKEHVLQKRTRYYAEKINRQNRIFFESRELSKTNIRFELSNLIDAATDHQSIDSAECAYAAATILCSSGTLQKANKIIDYGLQNTKTPKEILYSLTIKKGRNFRLLGKNSKAQELLSEEITPKSTKTIPAPKSILPYWEFENQYSTSEQLQMLEGYRKMELGSIEYNQANYDQAEKLYSSAMERFSCIHSHRGISLIQNGLANIYLGKGYVEKSLQMYQEATKLAQECQFLRHAGICLSQQANIFRSQGDFERSLSCYKESIAIQKKNGHLSSSTVGNLALLYSNMGKSEKSIQLYNECIQICIEEGNQKFEGINRGNLAEELYKIKSYEESIDMFEKAISICSRIFPAAEISFRIGLALAYIKVDRTSQAVLLIEKDAQTLQQIPFEYMKYLCEKIQAYIELRRFDKAKNCFAELEEFISNNEAVYHNEIQKKHTHLQAVLFSHIKE